MVSQLKSLLPIFNVLSRYLLLKIHIQILWCFKKISKSSSAAGRTGHHPVKACVLLAFRLNVKVIIRCRMNWTLACWSTCWNGKLTRALTDRCPVHPSRDDEFEIYLKRSSDMCFKRADVQCILQPMVTLKFSWNAKVTRILTGWRPVHAAADDDFEI